jgi:hypothetical protein
MLTVGRANPGLNQWDVTAVAIADASIVGDVWMESILAITEEFIIVLSDHSSSCNTYKININDGSIINTGYISVGLGGFTQAHEHWYADYNKQLIYMKELNGNSFVIMDFDLNATVYTLPNVTSASFAFGDVVWNGLTPPPTPTIIPTMPLTPSITPNPTPPVTPTATLGVTPAPTPGIDSFGMSTTGGSISMFLPSGNKNGQIETFDIPQISSAPYYTSDPSMNNVWVRLMGTVYQMYVPATQIPDMRVILYDQPNYSGNIVSDSGWIGNPANQLNLTTALTTAGLVQYDGTITEPVNLVTVDPNDQYSGFNAYDAFTNPFVMNLSAFENTMSLRMLIFRHDVGNAVNFSMQLALEYPMPYYNANTFTILTNYPGWYSNANSLGYNFAYTDWNNSLQ